MQRNSPFTDLWNTLISETVGTAWSARAANNASNDLESGIFKQTPVLSWPPGRRIMAILADLHFVVSSDLTAGPLCLLVTRISWLKKIFLAFPRQYKSQFIRQRN